MDILPDKEWWSEGNGEVFKEAVVFLKNKGLSEEEVVVLLTSLYNAVANEYGD